MQDDTMPESLNLLAEQTILPIDKALKEQIPNTEEMEENSRLTVTAMVHTPSNYWFIFDLLIFYSQKIMCLLYILNFECLNLWFLILPKTFIQIYANILFYFTLNISCQRVFYFNYFFSCVKWIYIFFVGYSYNKRKHKRNLTIFICVVMWNIELSASADWKSLPIYSCFTTMQNSELIFVIELSVSYYLLLNCSLTLVSSMKLH